MNCFLFNFGCVTVLCLAISAITVEGNSLRFEKLDIKLWNQKLTRESNPQAIDTILSNWHIKRLSYNGYSFAGAIYKQNKKIGFLSILFMKLQSENRMWHEFLNEKFETLDQNVQNLTKTKLTPCERSLPTTTASTTTTAPTTTAATTTTTAPTTAPITTAPTTSAATTTTTAPTTTATTPTTTTTVPTTTTTTAKSSGLYKIKIVTSKGAYAETNDADLFIELYGTKGQTRAISLEHVTYDDDNPNYFDHFQRGAIASFSVNAHDVGKITTLHLFATNVVADGWLCEEITVDIPERNEAYHFTVNKWIDVINAGPADKTSYRFSPDN